MVNTKVQVLHLPVLIAVDEGAGLSEYSQVPLEMYLELKKNFPIFCVDVVAIDKERRLFYLANRKRPTRLGWWWFGGRVGIDESPENAAVRKMLEETGLMIDPNRLKPAGVIFHYIFEGGKRETFPALQFTVELSVAERVAIQLDDVEYHAKLGVQAFGYQDLHDLQVYAAVVAMHKQIFP